MLLRGFPTQREYPNQVIFTKICKQSMQALNATSSATRNSSSNIQKHGNADQLECEVPGNHLAKGTNARFNPLPNVKPGAHAEQRDESRFDFAIIF
ncbi:hypothetical protein TNIN_199001 [Trichonephila inaurata madagascariensis]|uniref:Uncharacterized protein n=1 Tax=Trichonephila inaurata madagascariensis TaxID=2747483 RepID=A0A8X6YUR0_9ARAC|nr:hypothetical protein TNIN_199001 [Trichonephila inaurata madagascariensis]